MKELIQACQQRIPAAQKRLYVEHVDRLYYVVYRYTQDKFDVENLLQDIFLKIFNKIDSFDSDKGSFVTWSTTIAIRTAINFCKKSKIDFSLLNEELESGSATSELPLSDLDAQDLLDLIGSIEFKYRIVFNLYEIDGYKHDEIAQMLGVNASTSRSSLTRAKKLIREKIALTRMINYG